MPARDIKTTLAIDGEKQFKSAMDSAYRSMRVLGSEMKANTAAFGANAQSMDGLTQKGQILSRQIEQQKAIVAALAKAVEDSAAPYGENDAKTDGYRIKLNNASAALANMENEAADNQAAIDGLGSAVESTDSKTGKWSATLGKVAGILGKGLGAAAKGVGVAIGAIGTAAAAGAKKLLDASINAGKFADDLMTLSAQTGISTQTLQEWDYAARFIDTDVSTMTGSMSKMVRQMGAAAGGSKTAKAAFKELGVSITDSSGNLRDSEAVFMDAIDALGGIANETERDAAAMEIFGKSAQELNPLIKAGSDELKRLGQEAQDMGLVLSDDAVGALGDFDDTMQKIEAQTQGLTRSLAVQFLPALSGVMGGVQEILGGVGAALKDGFQPEDVTTVGNMIAQKLTEGIQTISQYLPSIISTVSGMLTQLISVVVSLLPTLLPALMDGATQLITGLMQAISANVDPLMAAAVTLITQFVTFLIENLPLLVTMATQMITSLMDGLTAALPGLIPVALDGVLTFVQAIIDNLPQIIASGLNMIMALIQGIINSIPKLIDRVPEIIQAVVATVTANLGMIISAGIEIIIALAGALIQAIPQLVAKIPEIITAIVNGLTNGLGQIASVGTNLLHGLWDGISSGVQWLYDKISGWASGVIDYIKSLFGIQSPSKLMRDMVGKQIPAGMAEGIKKNAGVVDKAMDGLVPSAKSFDVALNAKSSFDAATSYGAAAPRSSTRAGTSEISDSSVSRLVNGIKKALTDTGDTVIVLDDRELGRAVRRLVPA